MIAAEHDRHPAARDEFFGAMGELFRDGGNDGESVISGWRRNGGAPRRVEACMTQPAYQSFPAQRCGSFGATRVGRAGTASDADDADRRAGFSARRLVGFSLRF
jgi:hypothetical protein